MCDRISFNYILMTNTAANIKMLMEYLKYGISKTIINSYYIIVFSRVKCTIFSCKRQDGLHAEYENNRIQGDTCRQYIR